MTKHGVFVPTAALVLGLDQLGKRHVMNTLEVGERLPLFGEWFAWARMPSEGGALGLFSAWPAHAQVVGLVALALVAAIIVLSFFRGLAPGEHGSAAALGAILGGVVSNALDRSRLGAGLDFLHLGSRDASLLPDFNLADLAIIVGVVTLIVELLATEMASRANERPER